jgi:WD40 repeat protein
VGELRNVDLSQLAIRQAYLAEVDVQGASLVNAHLTETALADAFDFPGSVALSGDGALLAIGTSTGQVLLWRLADRVLQWSVQGPTGVVWGVALTADGRMLASSDAHGAVSLWDTSSGRLVAALDGNTGGVWGMDQTFDGVCH